ncbi:MAG: dihydrodipicolinate synthase family protein [Nocardioidaceae bacterium]
MSTQIAGVLPVVQTPFTEDGEIDLGALEREIDWVLDNGADGVVMGMVSEVLRLASEERDALAERLCRAAASRGRTSVVSVGAESTHTALRHAKAAESAGATAMMAIPPVTTTLGDGAVLDYYEQILAATRIPLVVQDASGYVGRPMSVENQARMRNEFGSRVLFKPEAEPIGPSISALRDATAGTAAVFEGSGGLGLIDNFRRGIAGTMPGADLSWATARLWAALSGGDFDRAYRIHGRLVPLITLQTSLDSFVTVEKYLLHRQGILANTVCRGPAGYELDAETRAEIDRLLEMLRDACGLQGHTSP